MKQKQDNGSGQESDKHESGRELSSQEVQLRTLDARSAAYEPPDAGPWQQYEPDAAA